MNEVIEKMYQEEIRRDSNRLFNDEIDRKWDELTDLIAPKFDISTQVDALSMLGDLYADSSKAGFEAGFRAAVRFFMNV